MNDMLPDLGQLRLDDVLKFLDVCRFADGQPPERRRSLRELCAPFGPHTTTVQQLSRIAEFFFGSPPLGRGPGLERLFKEEIAGIGIQPTENAKALSRQLEVFVNFSERLRNQFRTETQGEPRQVVRIGCIETLGLRVLASALSNWQSAFGPPTAREDIDLKVTIDGSKFLIPQLHAGLLDMVFAYGTANDARIVDTTYDVAFSSLDYCSRMVLLVHPTAELWEDDTDVNAGYFKSTFRKLDHRGRNSERGTRIKFEKLRSVRLERVDFRGRELITVPSWKHPPLLDNVIKKMQRDGKPVRLVDSYDRALALTRMGLGVAIAPEVFSKREGVMPFSLAPTDSYGRWIGIYYNTRERLSAHGRRIAEFLRSYIEKFRDNMRRGETPAIKDEPYDDWCEELTLSKEWAAREWAGFAQDHYGAPKDK